MVEDFKDASGMWVKSVRIGGKKHLTRSYSVWNGMKDRCKVGGVYQKKFPSYIGCGMSDMFQNFDAFVDWHRQQTGYAVDGYALDKDILDKGRKLYSEETCVLIPQELNSFYTPHVARRDLPQGVYLVKPAGKYKASVSVDNVVKHIGTYGTVDAAWAAFKAAKEAEAARWVSRLEAGEYDIDPRVVAALRNFRMER